MEKKIVLTMQPSKDIDIVVNDHDGMTIGKDQRTVRADDIYNLLAYSRGDIFCVESVNTEGKDGPVLQFFTELFQEIIANFNTIFSFQGAANVIGSSFCQRIIAERRYLLTPISYHIKRQR